MEPEEDDTEKELIRLTSDEVRACLWLGKGEEDDKSGQSCQTTSNKKGC